ncbi:uncharacterized protein LOC108742095 isoform X2 [Agrilus planipennis]|uniref:Uncharacterized protein LOC108742095 isoform X2 n=1 Tax=Agrilus planipennis TaxID=224129 RepID=A0A7F5R9F0_AGRPL|nr:uncharacterized protein LOC108742095 isoform X2 [Agrilus planipennis]
MSAEEKDALVYRSLSVPNISPSRKFEKLYINCIKINRNTNLRRQISCEVVYDKNSGTKESTIRILDSPLKSQGIKETYSVEFESMPPVLNDNVDKSIRSSQIKKTKTSVNEKCTSNGEVNTEVHPDTLLSKRKELEKFLKEQRDSATKSKSVKNKTNSNLKEVADFQHLRS